MTSAPVPAGPWLERWLSPGRFAAYLAAAHGDRDRALALYEWNAQLSAALMHDLAHLEVCLRNAYDAAITANRPAGPRPKSSKRGMNDLKPGRTRGNCCG